MCMTHPNKKDLCKKGAGENGMSYRGRGGGGPGGEAEVTCFCVRHGDLSQVSIVVPLHFEVKNFALCVAGLGDKVLV